jgi:hypothetical protein
VVVVAAGAIFDDAEGHGGALEGHDGVGGEGLVDGERHRDGGTGAGEGRRDHALSDEQGTGEGEDGGRHADPHLLGAGQLGGALVGAGAGEDGLLGDRARKTARQTRADQDADGDKT